MVVEDCDEAIKVYVDTFGFRLIEDIFMKHKTNAGCW